MCYLYTLHIFTLLTWARRNRDPNGSSSSPWTTKHDAKGAKGTHGAEKMEPPTRYKYIYIFIYLVSFLFIYLLYIYIFIYYISYISYIYVVLSNKDGVNPKWHHWLCQLPVSDQTYTKHIKLCEWS